MIGKNRKVCYKWKTVQREGEDMKKTERYVINRKLFKEKGRIKNIWKQTLQDSISITLFKEKKGHT